MSVTESAFPIRVDLDPEAATFIYRSGPVVRDMDVPAFPGLRIGVDFGGILREVVDNAEGVEISRGGYAVDNNGQTSLVLPINGREIVVPPGHSMRRVEGRGVNLSGVVTTVVAKVSKKLETNGKLPANVTIVRR